MYNYFFKRILDILISLVVLFLLFPLLVIATLLLTITNNGKPFFFQERPGKGDKIFEIIKLKTMNDRKGKDGELLSDTDRLTILGEFIRKTSLDEIPQLINVIKGDMSLVGPRPLLVEYLPLYNKEQAIRHNVRPGMTGWAQVNGRNLISWEEKFKLDIWYVENQSFLLDLKILILTIKRVFMPEGISSNNTMTMSKFTAKQ